MGLPYSVEAIILSNYRQEEKRKDAGLPISQVSSHRHPVPWRLCTLNQEMQPPWHEHWRSFWRTDPIKLLLDFTCAQAFYWITLLFIFLFHEQALNDMNSFSQPALLWNHVTWWGQRLWYNAELASVNYVHRWPKLLQRAVKGPRKYGPREALNKPLRSETVIWGRGAHNPRAFCCLPNKLSTNP